MKEVRIWEVGREGELIKMRATSIDFEERLEGWLEKDISVLDQDLLVIGRQVSTGLGREDRPLVPGQRRRNGRHRTEERSDPQGCDRPDARLCVVRARPDR